MSPAGSTRWCPTTEQVMMLEEMYRSGIKTPSASQIQQITSHLSLYGKIEGKNVFYWFQNHKARERQKLRKKLSKQLQLQQQQLCRLYYFDSMASPTFQPLTYYNSACHFPQIGVIEDAATAAAKQAMNYTWKFDIPKIMDVDNKSMMKTHGRDLLTMVDLISPSLSSSSPPCYFTKPPLKTLELFPVIASNLKEECNEISSKPLSCNFTINPDQPKIALTLH